MIDIVLLIGRLLFVALLYLFLFAIMKTGIGLVRGQRKSERTWNIAVERGPKELRGVSIVVRGPVIVGRSPGADIVVGAGYVSARHARFSLMGQYLPCGEADAFPELRRRITPREYKKVLRALLDALPAERIFAQELSSADEKFIPDFAPNGKKLF